MLESFLNFFNQPKLDKNTEEINEHLMLISGILVEAAAVDGKIEESEIRIIKKSLLNYFEVNENKLDAIVN